MKHLIALCLSLGFVLPLSAVPHFSDDLPDDVLADELIGAMTEEELLGQVFFLGYLGTNPSDHIRGKIASSRVGGVKIFTRNVENLSAIAESVREMQELALENRFGIPLLIATDQEGGWVQHIKDGSSVTPGNMAIGAGGHPGDAFRTGYFIGMEMRALGINMNFAPTVDVYSSPAATVIGSRSFSSDPSLTGTMALAYFHGMQKSDVISTAKHFPGHGGADRDSHGYLPEVHVSLDSLWEKDLLPYRLLIKEDLPAIMGGHLAFPAILGSKVPSTLSPYFLQEILRTRLDFKGVVITDDLEMYGVHQGELDLPSVSLKAIEAGNDMILLSHTPFLQDRTWDRLIQKLKDDGGFKQRITESVRRILTLKLRYLKNGFPVIPNVEAVDDLVPYPGAREFFLNSACRAVTLVQDGEIPFRPQSDERILLVGQIDNFFAEGRRRYPEADTYDFPYYPIEWSRKQDRLTVTQLAQSYDTIIFCLVNENSLEVLQSLEGYPGHLIVLSTLSPVYLKEVPWVSTAIAVYGQGRDSFLAGFGVLSGEIRAEGVMPLDDSLILFDPEAQGQVN